jgi:nucleotide-binding universal stress UspA family protein
MTSARKRVIVGVTGTLTNLRALQVAVDSARERDAVLYAVHVWETGHNLESNAGHRPQTRGRLPAAHNAGLRDAMGGPPADLDLRTVVVEGRPAYRLPRLAHLDTDLLVVGGGRSGRRSTGQAARHCVRQARCPVLVVPAPEMAPDLPAAARRTRRLTRFPADWTV